MKKVIVTGADGFVGSYTVRRLVTAGVEVIAIDIAQTPKRLTPSPGLSYIGMDLNDTEELRTVLEDCKCDTWFHFAWKGVAREKRLAYEETLQNATTTLECMKSAKMAGCTRFISAGSMCEKEAVNAIFAQGNEMDAASFYGIGKLLGHGLCKASVAQLGIEYVCGVISNVYGEDRTANQFISKVIHRLLAGERIECTEALQIYDFIHILDVAEAFYHIGEQGRAGYCYMVGSGSPRPLKEFLLEIEELAGVSNRFQFGAVPFRGGMVTKGEYDTTQLEQDTGFYPKISFEEGMKRMLEWCRSVD